MSGSYVPSTSHTIFPRPSVGSGRANRGGRARCAPKSKKRGRGASPAMERNHRVLFQGAGRLFQLFKETERAGRSAPEWRSDAGTGRSLHRHGRETTPASTWVVRKRLAAADLDGE